MDAPKEHGVPKQPKHKPYICGTCNKSYTTESALVIHSSKVISTFWIEFAVEIDKFYRFNFWHFWIDPTVTKYAFSFLQHKPLDTPQHHSEATSPAPSNSVVCGVCSESFISSEGLKEHKKIAHVNMAGRPSLPYSPMPCKLFDILDNSTNSIHSHVVGRLQSS